MERASQGVHVPKIVNHFPTMILDTIEASLLCISYVLLAPFSVIKWPGHLVTFYACYRTLVSQALVSQTLRCRVESKLGRWDRAAAGLEGVITVLEGHAPKEPQNRHFHVTLELLYTLVCEDYLRGGHIDDCAQAMIRANKSLNIDRLPGLPDFDVRSAQIVKAGLAAGRLLGDSGMATLMVTTDGSNPVPLKRSHSKPRKRHFPAKLKQDLSPSTGEAKIIPFPTQRDLHP